MTGGYRLSLEAQQDLLSIKDHYLTQAGLRIADKVLAEREASFKLIAARPGIGHRSPDLTDAPLRFWRVLARLIVYDPASPPIGIVRILHGRRDAERLLRQER